MNAPRYHFLGMPSSPYQNNSHIYFALGGENGWFLNTFNLL